MSTANDKIILDLENGTELGKIFERPDNDAFEAFQKVHKRLNFLDILQVLPLVNHVWVILYMGYQVGVHPKS